MDTPPIATLCDLIPAHHGADGGSEQSSADTTYVKVNGESSEENTACHSLTLSRSKSLCVSYKHPLWLVESLHKCHHRNHHTYTQAEADWALQTECLWPLKFIC